MWNNPCGGVRLCERANLPNLIRLSRARTATMHPEQRSKLPQPSASKTANKKALWRVFENWGEWSKMDTTTQSKALCTRATGNHPTSKHTPTTDPDTRTTCPPPTTPPNPPPHCRTAPTTARTTAPRPHTPDLTTPPPPTADPHANTPAPPPSDANEYAVAQPPDETAHKTAC